LSLSTHQVLIEVCYELTSLFRLTTSGAPLAYLNTGSSQPHFQNTKQFYRIPISATMPAINQRIYDWIDESLKGRNIPFPEEDRNDNTPLFFHLLHYDIRKTIYDMLLRGVGTRHHVTDSGPQRARPLMAVKCDDWLFERSFTCGHKSCEAARRGRAVMPEDSELVASQDIWILNNESKDRLENLVSFMKTCKTA
jgi:hypothetical protein